MQVTESGSSAWRWVGISFFAVTFGVPALLFLTLITYGAILIPLVGLAMIAPFILLNYLLWGRSLSRGDRAAELEKQQPADAADESSPPD
jgi:hypothetical protein